MINIIGDSQRKSRYDPNLAERVNREFELEEKREALKNKNKPKVQEPEKPSRIITHSEITNPQGYIILEGKIYEGYSYPDLFVAKERSHLNEDWNQCKGAVNREGGYMLTIRQFADFLSLLKSGKAYDGKGNRIDSKELERLFLDITEVRSPYRAEWLDARFENDQVIYEEMSEDSGLFIARKELGKALMKDTKIDLGSWLQTADEQGLPTSKTKAGSLYYYYPRNGYVAGFDAYSDWAGLDCDRDPGNRNAGLGVRLARSEAPKHAPKNDDFSLLSAGFDKLPLEK